MENNQNVNYTHQSSDNGNSNVVNINTGRTVSNSTSGDGPKKPSGKGKGRGVVKSILFGTVSAAAVAGVVAGAMYISGPNEYTLTYIVDGKVVEVNVEEDAVLSSIPAPSVTGYSFDGWYVDPTYTTMLTPGYKFNGDIELYPKFTPNKYTITYHSNNGVGGIFTQEVYFNSEYATIANTFVKPNYTFIGWSTDINARYDSSNIIPSSQVALLDTEGITLYAVWKGDDRSISFDTTNMMLNGTAYTIQDVTIPYGDTYTLPTILGTISHSTNASDKFAGYNINGNIYQPGSTIVITDNTNISINWQSASAMLNFNIQSPNGETISNISPMAFYATDDSYSYENLPAPDLATNYEFVGWNTKSDGSGTTYLVGDTYTTTESTTVLYAIWQGKQRTLNIYNAGTVVEVITCRYGDSIALPTYTIDKHTFLGFNSASNYTGTTYSGTINILFTDEIVNLYAEYSRNQITVSFNANGGIGSIDNIVINSEELYSLSATDIENQRAAITRRYYTLAGWSTDQNADPNTASFDIIAGSTNLPLYAIWSRNQVQVTYASNMDSTVPVAHKIDQGTDYTFSEAGFEKDGYYILEFKVNGVSYKSGDILPAVEVDNLRVEVVWKKIEKVLFKNAGNISTLDTVSGDTVSVEDVAIGTKIVAPYVAVENSYKTNANGDRVYFAGWATTENAARPTVFARSTEITITDTQQIYYAVYMEASVELDYVYDSNTDTYAAQLKNELNTLEEENYVLVIPNTYDGKAVTSIYSPDDYKTWSSSPIKSIVISEGVTGFSGAGGAFNSSPVENVTLPNSLKEIGQYLFSGCNKISKLIIPNGVETIKSNAFSGCGNGTLFIPNSVKTIESQQVMGFESIIFEEGSTITSLSNAFQRALCLKTITIPDSVTDISGAFENSTQLESIVIPSSVTNIEGAFQGCSSLSSVTLPSNLTEIGINAFTRCANLKNITIPNSVTTIKREAFYFSGIESIELPNTITTIEDAAFSNCTNLKNINIPDSVTSIEIQAFAYTGLESLVLHNGITKIGPQAFICSEISSINIPTQVTSISFGVFYGCANLKNITIPDNITSISNWAFRDSGLESITIPSSVNSINPDAFLGCKSLESVTINTNAPITYSDHFNNCPITTVTYGEGVTTIPDDAWKDCITLNTVNLPSTLTTIGESAFNGCYELTGVVIPEGVTEIKNYTFDGCFGLTNVTIPEGVTSIGSLAFGASGMNSITLPSSLRIIGSQAFNSSYLTSIVIPEGVTTIGESAFGYTSSLTSVVIPSTVTTIGENLFENCFSLKNVTINTDAELVFNRHFTGESNCPVEILTYGEGVTSIPDSAWRNCDTLTTLTFPNSLKSVGSYAFYNCSGIFSGGNLLKEGVETVGESAFDGCAGITSIYLPSTLTSVGDNAFKGMASYYDSVITINTNLPITYEKHFKSANIYNITFGDNVTTIPANAWDGAYILYGVTIGKNVTSVGNNAFANNAWLQHVVINTNTSITYSAHFGEACEYLNTVTYGDNVTTIPENAWNSACISYSVVIGKNVTFVGNNAFANNTNLQHVVINTNANITYGDHFSECTDIATVTYGEGVTTIPADAWKNCDTLTTLTCPNSLKSVGSYAFYNCSGIFPGGNLLKEGVETIGESAFDGCAGITSIHLPSTLTSVGDNAFKGMGSDYDLVITINTNLPITYERHFKNANIHSVRFDDNVTTIPENAWNRACILYSVVIGKNVTSVGNNAFANNSNLQHVVINTNTSITYSSCFSGCPITTVTYGEGVTSIPDGAWYCCGSITEVNLPDGLLEINENAFAGISRIDIHIPDSVTTIRDGAFEGHRVNLPESLEYIGSHAFEGAQITNDIPYTVTQIGEYAFYFASGITEINLENYVEIGDGAFSEMPDLETVFLHNYAVSNSLFYGCPLLKMVYLGSGVSGIGSYAFYNCTKLETIYLKNVRIIGEYAFDGCTNVKTMYFFETNPSNFQFTVDDLPFENIETIYVPFGHYTKYQNVFGSQYSDKMNTHEL